MEDGRPRFVTALGETNSVGGWRERKADGGALIDVPNPDIPLRSGVVDGIAPAIRAAAPAGSTVTRDRL